MNGISVTYNVEWQLADKPHYQFTKDGKCFNAKTNKPIKKVVKGYTVGFNIAGKFRSLKQLRNKLEKIQVDDCPF